MPSQGGSFLLHSYHEPFILPSKHVTEMTPSHKTCSNLLLLSGPDYLNIAKFQSDHECYCQMGRSSQHCYTIYALSRHILILPPSPHSNKYELCLDSFARLVARKWPQDVAQRQDSPQIFSTSSSIRSIVARHEGFCQKMVTQGNFLKW